MADLYQLSDLTGRMACVTLSSFGHGRRAPVAFAAAVVTVDVADRENVQAFFGAIATLFGASDILVHATGINTRQGLGADC